MYILGIEAFLAIVATHNLTKAAEILHLTQSSVSQRLKTLEQELGYSLIERNRGLKQITLTPEGEEFILLAEKWNALWRETQSLQSNPGLSLAVGAVDSMNTYVLPDIYQKIIRDYPSLRLKLVTGHSNELYDLMERQVVDVAFVLHERIVRSLNITPFSVEDMVVLRLASASNQSLAVIEPADLDPHEEIRHDWFPAYQIWHDKWWDPIKPSHLFVTNGRMVLSLLKTPTQWTIVPLSIARSATVDGRYVMQRLSDPPPDRVCFKLTHKFQKPSTKKGLEFFERAAELVAAGHPQTL